MTAINTDNQIPNAIVSLEQLAAWIGLTAQTINPRQRVLETADNNELVAQTGIFTAEDGTTRLFVRLSIELDPKFKSDNSKKLWMFAKEFSQTNIPADYLTN